MGDGVEVGVVVAAGVLALVAVCAPAPADFTLIPSPARDVPCVLKLTVALFCGDEQPPNASATDKTARGRQDPSILRVIVTLNSRVRRQLRMRTNAACRLVMRCL